MTGERMEVYQDVSGSFRWRLKAGNNEIVATGEDHPRLANARRAAKQVRPDLPLVIMPDNLYDPDTGWEGEDDA